MTKERSTTGGSTGTQYIFEPKGEEGLKTTRSKRVEAGEKRTNRTKTENQEGMRFKKKVQKRKLGQHIKNRKSRSLGKKGTKEGMGERGEGPTVCASGGGDVREPKV